MSDPISISPEPSDATTSDTTNTGKTGSGTTRTDTARDTTLKCTESKSLTRLLTEEPSTEVGTILSPAADDGTKLSPAALKQIGETSTSSSSRETSDDELARLFIGKLLVGTYLVEEELKKPGSNKIFVATDIRSDSKVAIVILPPEGVSDARELARLRSEETLTRLEQVANIRVQTFEFEQQYPYCVVPIESLEKLENITINTIRSPRGSSLEERQDRASIAVVAILGLLIAALAGFVLSPSSIHPARKAEQPVTVSTARPGDIKVSLSADSDLNPTNDFIAFDSKYRGSSATTGSIDMVGINRVIAQSVIVALNAQDIGTGPAATHARSVVSAAKNVAHSLRSAISHHAVAGRFSNGLTEKTRKLLQPNVSDRTCFVGEGYASNVYIPPALASAISVSLPSNLKSPISSHNGDGYMAGYSSFKIPVGGGTVDISGVPVFPLRTNELLTLDEIRESKDNDPVQDSDYLPPNAILIGEDESSNSYSDLVACTAFGTDKDFAACIPRGYIRITNGKINRDPVEPAPAPLGRTDSFTNDLWDATSSDVSSEPVFRLQSQTISPTSNNVAVASQTVVTKSGSRVPGCVLDYFDQIAEGNKGGASFVINQILRRMQQVDPTVTLSDVKAALSQTQLRMGETIFLYSPGPGGRLRCDHGCTYASDTVPNDGEGSTVEISCENYYNISNTMINANKGAGPGKQQPFASAHGYLRSADRVIFTPATGWRNLMGDIRFENEAKDSGTFSR